jgi:hypothetical protein
MSWFQILVLYVDENDPETPEVSTFYYKTDKTLDEIMDNEFFGDIIDKARERIEKEEKYYFVHAIITEFPIDEILKTEDNGALLNPDGTFLAKIDEGE